MAPIPVHIKHAGKVHDVQLDVDQPPAAFKEAVYQVTGVPPDRMKVMVKGGVLKDDTDWKKVAPKEGQTFMVVGAAGELPKPPEKPIVFLEDMDDSELAKATELPVGLVNLGNTCYMNATVQAMRAIPELQIALENSSPQGLAASLKGLYTSMGKTTDSVTPTGFLNALRQAFPQFAELARGAAGAMKGLGPAYAQQDAEECWVQMTNALRDVPGLPGPSGTNANKKFVEQYMTGELRQVLKCDEAPEEPPSTHSEKVLKLDCNITITTNYMQNGIMNALDTKIEKRSPSLGRDAMYSSTSRLARLPSYLTVHMVRFAWRQDIGKKTKIMRKVKFPTEYDALDIVTDDLKEKLLPVSRRLKEIEKDRFDRRVVRKKTKAAKEKAASSKSKDEDVDMEPPAPAASGSGEGPKYTPGEELKDEAVYREEELKELEGLVHPDLKADVGCSVAGLYDLVAIVTHKGAAADAGHYMGFVKKSALKPASNPGEEEDEDWYKFDDDKVSVFPKEKLATLDGGGEDSSAYVLLYKAKPLA